MLVPLKVLYPPPGILDRIKVPGAETSGLILPDPSIVTGPLLLEKAIWSYLSVFPTVKEAS
jgi:hypothetical protein